MKTETTYISLRIDYTFDPNRTDGDNARQTAQEKVVSDALAHIHTVENGVQIENIENCGESA